MSNYAYLDKQKHKLIYAKNCIAKDVGKDFYCPDPNCDGTVRLCAFNSNKVNAYFKGNNHSEDCSFYKNNINYHIDDFNTEDFSPSNLLNYIKKPIDNKNKTTSTNKTQSSEANEKKTNKYIHSIKSLYYLAINYPIEEEINGYKISDLVCFNKTSHIYIKYIKGLKLIVCKFHRYDNQNKCLYFNYQSKLRQIEIKVCFNDEKMYTNIRNKFYGYEGDALIFADWSSDNEYTFTTLDSIKQITAINN